MEPGSELAPPVVAVMVVHQPGAWFDDVLAGLARQDYANLRTLVLVAGDPGDVPDRVRTVLPAAFVRAVEGNPGFGRAANQVLELVEGDNGFFCLLHDDVALDPDAIRLLVEEMYRSNAGITGPKLVQWSNQRVLQHVGYDVDRFGEVDSLVEAGEVDQEQHDAVRDIFALPSACLMVRADLFRTLGGFDPMISYHGEDVDLCWRAHQSGARVVVVPAARARHREELVQRRPDLAHHLLRSRHRMRSVATLTGARRLPRLSLELTLLTLVELVIGVFTGRAAASWAAVRALFGLVPRTPALLARRRALAPGRLVPDREVVGLQSRGSARFIAYLRARDARPDPLRADQRGWRERAGASTVLVWLVLIAAVIVGSRAFVTGGVPAVGQFLPFGDSPGDLWRSYTTDWWSHGLGSSTPAPTGIGLVSVASVGTLFRMGVLHTLSVVGLLVVGYTGMWRIGRTFTTNRSRIVSLVVYAAVPLPAHMLSVGRWGALVCYAALPWAIDAMRRFAGLEAGLTAAADERVVDVSLRRRITIVAGASLVAAPAIAFEPSFALLLPAAAIVLALATLLTDTHWMAAVMIAAAGIVATIVGLALNLPWSASLVGDGGWTTIVGPGRLGDGGNSVLDLASFDLGRAQGSLLALALYLPVLAAPLIGRGWRYAWGVRAGFLVVAFAWLAVLDDRGSLPIRLPEPGIVLVPVAIGLALAAGSVAAAFELDVRGGSFGWRQPLGILSGLAIAIGVLPGIFALTTGRWDTPRTTMIDLLGQLPEEPLDGDYRVLWIGDQLIVPAAGQPYRPGVTYALTDNRDLEIDDVWATRPLPADVRVAEALDAIATGSTARAGRLLAPFAVRYIVIPVVDGAVSTSADPLPVPAGLLDALGDQLDLGEVYSPPNFVVFENKAWLPARSVLTAEGAEASKVAGAAALAQADVSGATPIMPGSDATAPSEAAVPAGTVHVAVPFDRSWQLEVDGQVVAGRPAFGSTLAFDVETAGDATLRYERDPARMAVVVAQIAGWVLVGALAANATFRRRRHSRGTDLGPVEPVLRLGSDHIVMPSRVGGLDPLVRPVDEGPR